jgi:AcrR family transcriptional regulator
MAKSGAATTRAAKSGVAGRPIGRPRLFDDEAERSMLIAAAIETMGRKGYGSMSVGDVLEQSGLSTRAFYRHFESKEALLDALMLREAQSVGRALARAVAGAPGPVAAVDAWLERYLDVFYQPRRAERAALIRSEGGRSSRLSDAMRTEMRRISCVPLVGALRAGHEAGLLSSPTPELDAYSLHDLVAVCFVAGELGVPGRAEARAHVVRFAYPALGLDRPRPRKSRIAGK